MFLQGFLSKQFDNARKGALNFVQKKEKGGDIWGLLSEALETSEEKSQRNNNQFAKHIIERAHWLGHDMSTTEKLRDAIRTTLKDGGAVRNLETRVNEITEYAKQIPSDQFAAAYPPPSADEIMHREAQKADDREYQKDMNQWDELSQAVGGNLFEDPDKLAAMRRVDKQHGATTTWAEFRALVIDEIESQKPATPVASI